MRQSAPVQRIPLPGSPGPRGGLPQLKSIAHIQARVRSYGIVWHVHDSYPTCLTGLRVDAGRSSVCLEPLSTKCLSKIEAGCCTKEEPGSSFSYFDLAARIERLRSARYADAVIVASELMKRLLIGNHPEIANKVHLDPHPVEGRIPPAGELESLANVMQRVRRSPRHELLVAAALRSLAARTPAVV